MYRRGGYGGKAKIPIAGTGGLPRSEVITAGEVDVATLYNGTYDLYAWGASGSPADAKNMKVKGDYLVCNNHGGTGAYVRGTLKLSEPKNVFVYVGESGKSTGTSYNGGGAGSEHKDVEKRGMSGGGATDFCVGVDNHCNDMKQHYQERILVAGGGGGGHSPDTCWSKDSTELACGGDAKAILRDGMPWIDFRASSGWSRSGIAWEGRYLAPPGQDKQNYRIHSSYNPKNQPLYAKHEELFGVGQDAVKDAEIDPLFKCSSEGGLGERQRVLAPWRWRRRLVRWYVCKLVMPEEHRRRCRFILCICRNQTWPGRAR